MFIECLQRNLYIYYSISRLFQKNDSENIGSPLTKACIPLTIKVNPCTYMLHIKFAKMCFYTPNSFCMLSIGAFTTIPAKKMPKNPKHIIPK